MCGSYGTFSTSWYVRAVLPHSAAPCLSKWFQNETLAVLFFRINHIFSRFALIFHGHHTTPHPRVSKLFHWCAVELCNAMRTLWRTLYWIQNLFYRTHSFQSLFMQISVSFLLFMPHFPPEYCRNGVNGAMKSVTKCYATVPWDTFRRLSHIGWRQWLFRIRVTVSHNMTLHHTASASNIQLIDSSFNKDSEAATYPRGTPNFT